MRTRLSILLVFVMVLTFVPLGPAAANGYWPISDDTTLTEDYHGTIGIVADGVTLDCEGFKVIGDGSGTGIFMGGRTGVTIRNCDVSLFQFGIQLEDSTGNAIEENDVHDNVSGEDFAVGIILGASPGNSIRNNVTTGNGAEGIILFDSDHNTISDNIATGNHRTGIILAGSDDNLVIRNESSDNLSGGFWTGDSNGNTFERNEIHNNAHQGLNLWNSDGNTVISNIATGNGGTGFHVSGGSTSNIVTGNTSANNGDDGIGSWMADSNVISSNEVWGNGGPGIGLGLTENTTVADNLSHGNGEDGISLRDSHNTVVENNLIDDNGGNGISVWGDASSPPSHMQFIGNVSADNVNHGFFIEVSVTNLLANIATGNGAEGFFLVNADGTEIVDNQALSNESSGIMVGDSTAVSLVSNEAENNAENGIQLWSADDSVVVGNTATGNAVNGIGVWSSEAGQVVGNAATGNCTRDGWTCAGISLGGTSGSLVDDNTVTDNVNVSLHGQAFGILLGGANDNTVSSNLVARNGHDGIHLGSGSDGNTVVGNTATGNLRGGIDLHNGASNNAVTGNTANDNAWSGFVVIDSVNNTLSGNQAHNNDLGFQLWSDPHSVFPGSSGNMLAENWAVGNVGSGFDLGGSDGNELIGNVAEGNGYSGFGLHLSDGNRLEDNQADRNANWGFEVGESSFNMLIGNQAVGNGDDGFAMWPESHDNVLRDNHAVGNRAGFVIVGGHSNTYEGNHAVNNQGWTGFWFSETEGNTVIDNVARNNGSGFQLADAHEHELSGNTAVNNVEHGFVLWESSDNTLTGNTAVNNGDKKSEDGGIGFDVSVGSIRNTLTGNRGHNNTVCDAADWFKPANSWSDNDLRVWCESEGEVPVLTPVEWAITLDDPDWGPGIHTVFMIVEARPLIVDLVEDLSGRLIWDETVVDLCTIHIREVGDGFLHIGDIYQTIEGCYEGDTTMQDAFRDFGLPDTACVAVRVGGVDHEYCARLDVLGDYPLLLPAWTAREDVYEAGYVLAEALSEVTGEAFFGVPVESPRDMYDLLCAMPETAVGVGVNTLVYSFASEDCGVDASSKSIRYGYDTYWTEFLVPRDGGITQLSDLSGKSWVYPSPTLTSYYYVALAVMAEAGVTPGDAFDAGSSTAAVSAVYYRESDFGTVFYSPYVDVDGAIQWDFDPANADLPDISDCHFVTEAVGAFAEGDLVCGPTGGVWPDEYLEVRDARRTAEAPDIVDEVRILTLSPGVPNDAVAFGAEFDTDLRASVEDALRLFADEASPHFEEVWLPSLDLLYRWDGINPADDSDWDWIRGALATAGFGVDDL